MATHSQNAVATKIESLVEKKKKIFFIITKKEFFVFC